MRAVAGQPATIRVQVASDDGAAVVPDSPPTVTVTGGDGALLVGPLTGAPDDSLGDGGYKASVVAPTQLDVLTATWTVTVGGSTYTVPVEVDVVGQRLVSPYTLRQSDTNLAGLSPVSLLTLVDQVEDLISDSLGYSPVLEGARTEWDTVRGSLTDDLTGIGAGNVNGLPYGWGGGRMLIPGYRRPLADAPGGVYAMTVNGTPLDPADLAALTTISGALAWRDYRPWISGRYSAWFAHGDPSPAQDLRWAATKLVSYYGKTNAYPERASQVTTEGATIWFALPGPGRPTGIPDVDGVLNRYAAESVI